MVTNRRIRVLHVVYSFRAGGMENIIAQMANLLAVDDFEIAICVLERVDDFSKRLPDSVRIYTQNKNHGFSFRCIRDLRALVDAFKPDLIHSHNWSGLVYSYLSLLGKNTKLLHGEHSQFYHWELNPLRLILRKVLYFRADAVHTISVEQAKAILGHKLIDHQKLFAMPNGVDSFKFRPQDKIECRRHLGLDADKILVGMVARCIPEKRHWMLLEAFGIIADEFPELDLVFAGSGGGCESAVKSLISKHTQCHRIHWLGHRDDLNIVYGSLDLLVLPSKAEGMSNVCLEAMSSGLTVLIHNACGVSEMIQDGVNGCIIEMDSPSDIVAGLRVILANKDYRKKIGHAARDSVDKRFTLRGASERYADVYRRLAAQH